MFSKITTYAVESQFIAAPGVRIIKITLKVKERKTTVMLSKF